jgi:hypothetical protein
MTANRTFFLHCSIKSLAKPAWAPFVVFGIHLIAFNIGLYKTYPLLDIPMHFFGGLAIAYFLSNVFVNALGLFDRPSSNGLVISLLVCTSTCTIAVFWELAEFALSWSLSANLQGGLANTMRDLFFGFAGSLFFVAACSPIHFAPRLIKSRNPTASARTNALKTAETQ